MIELLDRVMGAGPTWVRLVYLAVLLGLVAYTLSGRLWRLVNRVAARARWRKEITARVAGLEVGHSKNASLLRVLRTRAVVRDRVLKAQFGEMRADVAETKRYVELLVGKLIPKRQPAEDPKT